MTDFSYSNFYEESNAKSKRARERKQEKQVVKFCAHRGNPNCLIKSEGENQLFLHVAVYAGHVGVVKILLSYGADPRIRFGDFFDSPLENILKHTENSFFKKEAYEMLNAINWASNKPRAPIENVLTVKTIYTQNLQPLHNSLMTTFEFSNSKSLISFLLRANIKLPDNSSQLPLFWNNLYKMFCKYFNFRHNKSYEAFKDNFGLNKYIDLLYEENHLIGFYEMVFSETKGYFIQYNVYSALKEEYRGYRISTLLGTRSAFSMQQIYPYLKGGVFFFAVSYNSFRQVEMLDPYPKFLTHTTDKFIQDNILPHLLQPEEKFFKDDGIMRYIEDESACDPCVDDTTDPNRKMLFNKYILGLNKEKEQKSDLWTSRSAPVFFPTTTENLKKISGSLKKINVDFQGHIKELETFFKKNKSKEEEKSSSLKAKL